MDATCGAGTATLPEHLSSPPVFSGVRVAPSLVFCVLYIVVWPFLFFLLTFCVITIVLSVLFRFTAFDYPFGIFKLFLYSESGKIDISRL